VFVDPSALIACKHYRAILELASMIRAVPMFSRLSVWHWTQWVLSILISEMSPQIQFSCKRYPVKPFLKCLCHHNRMKVRTIDVRSYKRDFIWKGHQFYGHHFFYLCYCGPGSGTDPLIGRRQSAWPYSCRTEKIRLVYGGGTIGMMGARVQKRCSRERRTR